MATRDDLLDWIVDAPKASGGSSSLIEVSRYEWDHHEDELRQSGDLFYTWQYVIRWAAHELRRNGVMRDVADSPSRTWQLAKMP
jgi:hypothetical protein